MIGKMFSVSTEIRPCVMVDIGLMFWVWVEALKVRSSGEKLSGCRAAFAKTLVSAVEVRGS